MGAELLDREGFEQTARVLELQPLLGEDLPAVPGEEQDPQPRPHEQQPPGELRATDAGHLDIGHQGVDRPDVLLRDEQRLTRIGGLEHLVAGALERAPGPPAHLLVVFGLCVLYGAVVACGDVDNDRVDEILTAPGPHPDNPPWLKTWSYDGSQLTLMESRSFMVFEEEQFVAGAKLACGNFFEPAEYLP